MDFKNNDPIYLQIAELICEKILTFEWTADSKILSVRDLAIEMQVNPNTVMRSYEYLQNKSIIYNKRGIGFFVGPQAITLISQVKKQRFLEEELPVLFKNMLLLNLSFEEIHEEFKKFNKKTNNENQQ